MTRITAHGIIANGHVKLAVGSEVNCSSIMVGRAAQVIQVEYDDLASWHSNVA